MPTHKASNAEYPAGLWTEHPLRPYGPWNVPRPSSWTVSFEGYDGFEVRVRPSKDSTDPHLQVSVKGYTRSYRVPATLGWAKATSTVWETLCQVLWDYEVGKRQCRDKADLRQYRVKRKWHSVPAHRAEAFLAQGSRTCGQTLHYKGIGGMRTYVETRGVKVYEYRCPSCGGTSQGDGAQITCKNVVSNVGV